jgi:tetratricopeptide (TPR) repeat protein
VKLRLSGDSPNGRCLVHLADQSLARKPLALCSALLAAQLEVRRQLDDGSFGDELGAGESAVVQRYGHDLWKWLVEGLDGEPLEAFLASSSPTIEIHGNHRLHELFWETLNSRVPPDPPRWLALSGSIERIMASRDGPSPGKPRGALVISARPYLNDDVPIGVPIEAIVEACHRQGTTAPKWLPGASLDVLSRFDMSPERLALLHLDTHAIRAERQDDGQVSGVSPHPLLESAQGAEPVTVSALLDRLGGPPPLALLLTSCNADATDVTSHETIQREAFVRGVELVIVARRRLTPAEVEVFSAALHGSLAAGRSIATCVRVARLALYEAGHRHNADLVRIGRDAWASFTLHAIAGGADPAAPMIADSLGADADASPMPPLPPPLTRPIVGHRIALIQVADDTDRSHWQERFARWLPILADDAYGDARVRIRDWSPLTEPAAMLTDGDGANGSLQLPLETTGAPCPRLDVIFVRCDPGLLSGGAAPFAELYPLTEGWQPPEILADAPPALRWLGGHALEDNEVSVADLHSPTRAAPADPEFDELLEQTIAAAGCESSALWAGLASCSEGLLRMKGASPDEGWAAFAALGAFVDRARFAGLARRRAGGRFVLDRLHPRLSAAIRRHLLSLPQPRPSPWLDWIFRVGVCVPRMHFEGGELLPDHGTLADRLHGPDDALGWQVAEITARNYLFHAVMQIAAGSAPDDYWPGLWEQAAERMPAGLDRLISLTETVRKCSLDPADAFVDLKTTPRPQLASLVLSNGFLPGMSVLQTRAEVHASIAAIFMTDPAQVQEPLERLAAMSPWPEDRGHVWSAGAAALIELGREDEAQQMLANALEEQLVCEGAHATSHCVEALTMRAAMHRKAGLWDDWRRDVGLARKLIRSGNWTAFTSMVDDFLGELWVADERDAYRAMIAFLWRTADGRTRAAAWLIRRRIYALIDAARYREAETVLEGLDRDNLSERTRSILDLFRISCLLEKEAYTEAIQTAEKVETYATDTVLADVHRAHAKALERRGRPGESEVSRRAKRIELLRRGSEVPDGGWAGAECRMTLSRELLEQGDYDGCVEQAGVLRRSGRFPFPVKAAGVEAAALALAGLDRDRALAAAGIACWNQDVQNFVLMRLAFQKAGWMDDLQKIWEGVVSTQNEWLLEGEPDPPEEVAVNPATFARCQLEQLRASPPPDLSELGDEQLAELRRALVVDWQAWKVLSNTLWDRGRLNEALIYLEMSIHVLELHPLLAEDEEIRLAAISAQYARASLNRSLSRTDAAIEIGTMVCSRASGELAEGTSSEQTRPELVDTLSLALEMLGNCQFDKGNFLASLAFHGRALLVAIGSDGVVDVEDVLAAVKAKPISSWRVVSSLCNWGNSLRRLGLADPYYQSRTMALLLTEPIENFEESVRTNPTNRYALSLIDASFEQDIPADHPIGRPLARLRSALATT